MKRKTTYRVIGMMSGTSLDGLDIACCQFTRRKKWEFEIQSATTIRYSGAWKKKLTRVHVLSGEDLMEMDSAYGKFMGKECRAFIHKSKISHIDLIASHGHTIFHQPQRGFTFQLGKGAAIQAVTGLPVVSDFRSLDVQLGGEGAPLVPLGDRNLFGQYDVCLNLGGIANLSMEQNGERIAFDICYANMGLNYLAQKTDMDFDRDGQIASRGELDTILLEKLVAVYKAIRKKRPSLGREGFELNVLPLLSNELIPLENRMITFCQSIVDEIHRCLTPGKKRLRVLVTGGGVLNPAIITLLTMKLEAMADVIIPSRQIIEFKEALVFAFLGLLRTRGEVNVLKSVTHAIRDSSSGLLVE
jgi:anhydro-N-acetylmuramic acid kinase